MTAKQMVAIDFESMENIGQAVGTSDDYSTGRVIFRVSEHGTASEPCIAEFKQSVGDAYTEGAIELVRVEGLPFGLKRDDLRRAVSRYVLKCVGPNGLIAYDGNHPMNMLLQNNLLAMPWRTYAERDEGGAVGW